MAGGGGILTVRTAYDRTIAGRGGQEAIKVPAPMDSAEQFEILLRGNGLFGIYTIRRNSFMRRETHASSKMAALLSIYEHFLIYMAGKRFRALRVQMGQVRKKVPSITVYVHIIENFQCFGCVSDYMVEAVFFLLDCILRSGI